MIVLLLPVNPNYHLVFIAVAIVYGFITAKKK